MLSDVIPLFSKCTNTGQYGAPPPSVGRYPSIRWSRDFALTKRNKGPHSEVGRVSSDVRQETGVQISAVPHHI